MSRPKKINSNKVRSIDDPIEEEIDEYMGGIKITKLEYMGPDADHDDYIRGLSSITDLDHFSIQADI